MEWLVILVAGYIALVAAVAIAAARVNARRHRRRVADERQRAAIWQAGYTDRDLRVLAELAAASYEELGGGAVEIVFLHGGGSGDGVVVTGSRVPASRLGARVPYDEGLAGFGLVAGRTIVTDTAACIPIRVRGAVVGVMACTSDQPVRPHVAQLEALADGAGDRLGPRRTFVGENPSSRRNAR